MKVYISALVKYADGTLSPVTRSYPLTGDSFLLDEEKINWQLSEVVSQHLKDFDGVVVNYSAYIGA